MDGNLARISQRSVVRGRNRLEYRDRALLGATLVRCGGVAPAKLADSVLRFRGDVSDEASVQINAPWLLFDDANPFVLPPTHCTFQQSGLDKVVRLHWVEDAFSHVSERFWPHDTGTATPGVHQLHGGYWIGVGQLTSDLEPTLATLKQNAVAVHSSRFVVLDLRGDTGGDDAYGVRLAAFLYSRGGLLRSELSEQHCDSVFRASTENLRALQSAVPRLQTLGDFEGADQISLAVIRMKAALTHHDRFTASNCASGSESRHDEPEPANHVPLVLLLTDAACYSSCLNTVALFRRLGAIQIGQPTGAGSHYSEVRAALLPSGLSRFATVMAVMTNMPKTIGPFYPAFPFDRDMNDTASLEEWVRSTVLQALAGTANASSDREQDGSSENQRDLRYGTLHSGLEC